MRNLNLQVMKKLNLKDESGQAMILTLLCMTILLGFVGFAADVGVMFHTKRNMQIAADSAAIAGASELNYLAIDNTTIEAVGQAAAAQDGVVDGTNGDVVDVHQTPLYGAFAGNSNYVEAIVTQNQPTFFARLFNLLSINVAARAVATMDPGQNCIYALGSTGSDIAVNGTFNVSVPNCSIFDDSGDPAALVDAGTGLVTSRSAGVVGGYSGASQFTPLPVTGIAPVSDPLAYLAPPAYTVAGCLPDPAISSPTSLPQGCYNGLTIGGAATVTLNGMYIINGPLNITGSPTITGTNVTFYLPVGATFAATGTPIFTASAPTSGDYNGLLLYEDPGNTQPATLTVAAGSTLEGIVYAPSAAVTLSSVPTASLYTSIVVGSLILNGTGTLQDYALINGSSVLTAATLVE